MNNDVIELSPDDYKIVNSREYGAIEEFFISLPDIAHPLINDAINDLENIKDLLNKSPAFINLVKAMIPKETFIAVLTDEKMKEIAEGALELMTKKNGALMAQLRDPKTKKILETIDLQKANLSPELNSAMVDFSTQMQMAQIAEEIHNVQIAVEHIEKGLESDRLATAYSIQQNFKLAFSLKNPQLRENALFRVAMDAESSRNTLMLSQGNNIISLTSQPEQFWAKVFKGTHVEKDDQKISELRESMCALNMVSMVEALSYQALGETDAAVNSLQYYGDFMNKTYGDQKLLERLDGLDPADEEYWSKSLPLIKEKILGLPVSEWDKVGNTEVKRIDGGKEK